MTKTLPDKPSDLAELALRDMRKAIKSPRYHIHMGGWHIPNETCAVCAAGAVMAFTLGASHDEHILPGCFSYLIKHKLLAIDCLRLGDVDRAFRELGLDYQRAKRFNRDIPGYKESNHQPFFHEMRELVWDLRDAGY